MIRVMLCLAPLFASPALAQEIELSPVDAINLQVTNVGRGPISIIGAKVNYRDECALVASGKQLVPFKFTEPDAAGNRSWDAAPAVLQVGENALLLIASGPCGNPPGQRIVAVQVETDQGVVEFSRR